MGTSFPLRLFWVFFAETVGDFLLFPLWWYSRGLLRTFRIAGRAIVRRQHTLALGLWVTNLFKPMYGQEDWQGRLVSFIFRMLVLFWRLILFVIWVVFVLLFIIIYIALPLFALYGLVTTLTLPHL